MTSRKVFTDNSIQRLFESDGYVVLKNFIPLPVLRGLDKVFDTTLPDAQIAPPFFTTHWSPNALYRAKVNKEVSSVLMPYFKELFYEYKSIFGYFLTKYPSPQGEVTLHRDWTLVDEEKFTGVIAWAPLCDINIENGCFRVVKGSHLENCGVRGSNINIHYNTSPIESGRSLLSDVPLMAGDVLLFDQRLLHASPANYSDKIRNAAGLVLIPAETNPVHFMRDEDTGDYYRLSLNDDFLLETYFVKSSPKNITEQIVKICRHQEMITDTSLIHPFGNFINS